MAAIPAPTGANQVGVSWSAMAGTRRSPSHATSPKQAAAVALPTAVKRFTRQTQLPTPMALAQTCDISTQRGVPGGCGIPRILEAARNSPASQSVTVGARLATKSARVVAKTASAKRQRAADE